jgi:hypothetical protein
MTYQPGLLQIRPQYTDADASTHENVTWWLGATPAAFPLDAGQLTTIQAAFDTAWETMWGEIGADATHYIGSVVTDWSSAFGLTVDNTGYTPVAGTHGQESGSQVSALLSLTGARRYKGGHGRTYLPCVGVDVMASGTSLGASPVVSLNSAAVDLQTAMAGIATIDGGAYAWNVYHQKPHIPPPFLEPIVAVVANVRIATQRRRLRKVAHT